MTVRYAESDARNRGPDQAKKGNISGGPVNDHEWGLLTLLTHKLLQARYGCVSESALQPKAV
jgi:hypothetical protein